ncbi:hypothetical protein AMTRI_Chr08g204430 [Amborella trichopoda]|uniref:RING-type E3 ubiquitin transferase n=1 Tax=Amborella trichopoda TaxID=13333 RepID=W1PKZ0_AMBTC|nr:hypothetical protein AMTR_s00012p00151770 [Amborella trichopoda]
MAPRWLSEPPLPPTDSPPPQLLESPPLVQPLNHSPFFYALIGIISAALLLTAYHWIAIGWCAICESRHQRGTPADPSSGLDNSSIELIPAYQYQEGQGGGDRCAVCLCDFKSGEDVRVLPECAHSFHLPCIDMWLHSHTSCPLCRTDTMSHLLASGNV